MRHNRRQFVVGAGTVLIGALGIGTSVFASEHEIPVVIAAVYPEEEYIVLENQSDEEVNVSGYQINFEHGQQTDQIRSLPDGTSIAGGGQLTVATGATDVEADVTFDYDRPEINNEDPDVIALLSPSGEVVATSDGDVQPPEPEPPEEGDGEDGDEEDEEDEETGSEGDDQEEEEIAEDEGDDEAADEEEETADEETDEDDC